MKIGGIIVPNGPGRGLMLKTYSLAIKSLKKKGYDIDVRLENFLDESSIQSVPADLMAWFEKEADAILLLLPQDCGAIISEIEELKKKVSKPIIPLSPMGASLSTIPAKDLKVFWDYVSYKGIENTENLLLYSGKMAGKIDHEVPVPVAVPDTGVYHPGSPTPFPDIKSYMEWYSGHRKGKIRSKTAGILFPNIFYQENSLEVYGALIRRLEENGFDAICVFHDRWGGKTTEEVVEEFFAIDGKPIIDAMIIYAAFFLTGGRGGGGSFEHGDTGFLKKFNVPCLKMIHSVQSMEEWKENPKGLSVPQIIISVALPEFDGLIEPVIIGVSDKRTDEVTGAEVHDPVPIGYQIDYLIKRLNKWIELRRKPNSEKKVAIIFHNSPCKSGVEASVGAGFGLDTLESVALLLKRMKNEGYDIGWVPENGKELIDTIMKRKAISEFRWTPLSDIVKNGGAAAFVPLETYKEWLYEIPGDARNAVFDGWGNPFEGVEKMGAIERHSLALYNNSITIPGLDLGNVFIGLQPKRGCAGAQCDGTACKILHDPDIAPTHQYIAYYKWIEKVFGADVMVHVGTHGNIELLPGKTVAQSASCFSHICVGTMPHLYIYVSSNPMEGSIAKRRGLATIVDHLHPVMSNSETYGVLEELEEPMEEYSRAKLTDDKGRARVLQDIIIEKAAKASFPKSLDDFSGFDEYAEYVHGQMNLVRETMIRDGLHILGQVPAGNALVEMLVSILRFDQGKVPSIRRGIIEAVNLDYDQVLGSQDSVIQPVNMTGGKLLDECTGIAKAIVARTVENPLATDEELIEIAAQEIQSFIKEKADESAASGLNPDGLRKISISARLALDILPKIAQTPDEINNLIRGFNGEYIEAGASGALARGKIEILPTGRNFYAIDPWKIPTPAAWKVGVNLAEKFFHKYIHENGDYPENVGFVFRFFDTFRADGELLSQILYTLGVQVVWDGPRVKGLKVIPLDELKRPRIDITVQLSSMLRDGMPSAFEMVDEAVQMVAYLDEPDEMNFVKKHAMERLREFAENPEQKQEENGIDPKRLATLRVFTTQPGTYDYGVNTAIAAQDWTTDEDLAGIFTRFCGFAYGKGIYGKPAKQELESNLKRVTVTYDKWDSDEYDILDCCHIYGSHGGFTVAAKVISGKDPKVYFADTHDPERPVIRDMKDELERVARTRLLNPKWIEGKKRHGYKGATNISDRVYHMYGWQATTKLVGGWVFDDIAKTFVLDDEMREWFQQNNPWALESLTRRLLEAEQRDLWDADTEVLDELRKRYAEIEGWMEENMGEIEVIKPQPQPAR
jgi:cobaltochelatase CobN